MEPITQSFQDEIAPVRVDVSNGDGRIITIVDWAAEAAARTPAGATNIQWSFTCEYLSAHYYFPSLMRIPSSELPLFELSDTDETRQAKSIEFKRRFSPSSGYAVQFLLWRWFNGGWRPVHSARDWLQYLGLEGHISLLYPYFLDEPGVMFGGTRHKIGLSISPRNLEGGDYIEINGGYSGSVSFVSDPNPENLIESAGGSVEVGGTPELIVTNNIKRAALYVSNAGTTRLFFRFGSNSSALVAGAAPFIEPGESLSVEHGRLIYSGGGSQHTFNNAQRQLTKLQLWAVRRAGIGPVCFQELRFE